MNSPDSNHITCNVCLEGKSRVQNKNKIDESRPQKPLHRLQFDLSGPHIGSSYHQLGVDAATDFTLVHIVRTKTQLDGKIMGSVEFLEKQTDKKVKTIRTDGAKEKNTRKIREFMKKKGIQKETSAPYCQSQNGLVERKIQTVNNIATCMLLQSGVPKSWWPYAVKHAVYIQNRIPRNGNKLSPFELIFERKPDTSLLKTFGCEAWAHTPKTQRRKFESKSIWRFKKKLDGRYKARLCFDGRFQEEGVDFDETFAPVTRPEVIRIILTMALARGCHIELGDVPNAFLNAKVDKDVTCTHQKDSNLEGKSSN